MGNQFLQSYRMDLVMTRLNIYPYGSHQMDDKTGMPAVPEGYFWRVKKNFLGGGFWEVQLRQRGAFWSSRVTSRHYGAGDRIDREHILMGAAFALARWQESASNPDGSALLGDYPPKKLK